MIWVLGITWVGGMSSLAEGGSLAVGGSTAVPVTEAIDRIEGLQYRETKLQSCRAKRAPGQQAGVGHISKNLKSKNGSIAWEWGYISAFGNPK